jgi:hypothetical protein
MINPFVFIDIVDKDRRPDQHHHCKGTLASHDQVQAVPVTTLALFEGS